MITNYFPETFSANNTFQEMETSTYIEIMTITGYVRKDSLVIVIAGLFITIHCFLLAFESGEDKSSITRLKAVLFLKILRQSHDFL